MRIAKRLFHALLIVLTLVIGTAAAAVIVIQTAWFKDRLRGYIEREANQYLNGRLSIQRLGGNLFFGVEMENIGLSMDGRQVVAVKDLGLDYNVFELISKGLSVDNIRLNKPVLYLRREGDTWSISRLVKKQRQEADRQGPEKPIAIDDIGISDGSVVIDGPVGTSGIELPKRFDRLDAKFNFKYEPVHYSIEITHVSFRGSEPAVGLNALSGVIAVRNDTLFVEKLAIRTEETSLSVDGAVQQYLSKPILNMQITSDKFSLPEMARLVPALAGVRLQPAFEVKLNGPMERLGVDMNVRSSAGQITGQVVADVMAPGQSVTGDLSVHHLNLAPIVRNPQQQSDITGEAHVDVHGTALSDLDSLRGDVTLSAPRVAAAGFVAQQVKAKARFTGRRVEVDGGAAAYGARVTAAGHVTLPEGQQPLTYDVHGRALHVDLRRFPADLKIPPAETNVNAQYHVRGAVVSDFSPTSQGNALSSVTGDARFEPSTVAGAKIAAGSTAAVSIRGDDLAYQADATVNDLDLQRVGEAFHIPALAVDRYKTSINGHVTASGVGTDPHDMDLTAQGTLTDSSVLGGRIPQLAFNADLALDTAHVKANGDFADFDPATASGNPAMKGTVGGTLDLDATVSGVSQGVTTDSVEATAKLSLQQSTIGGLQIDRADVDADYHRSSGVIRSLDIKGRDLNVQASGALALNDTDQSNVKFQADSPSLDEIGKLIGQPLTGIAKVDGTLTGNKHELTATGNFTGDGVKYGDNGALTLSADFTVKVPELTIADAKLSATTNATFVTVAGQNINELTAKTDYDNQQLTFDATAKQPQRSLAAAGSMVMHPDHREIHLERLSLQTQGQQWQLAPGAQPAIQYENDVVAVKDLKLASGDQQIAADGSFGHAGDALKVTLNSVDLASVDALLLRPPQFSGRVNAASTITGTKEAPVVKADFQISKGGFRQFRYDSFGGTVNYAGKGVTLDTKLQQNPSAYITARGYVPIAAFKVGEPNRPTSHHEALAPEDRIDLHVESSPIDAGLVQGFTTALTNVKGTVQAKIDVTGAADDPHPNGAVTIQNAAFTVGPTGVTYTDLDGRIDLQNDRVHIDHIRVLDNQRKPLSVTGDLAVHELEVGAFNVAVKADDFKVIDNDMGNVRVDSDLRISGELRRPRIEGDLGVSTGVVNLDPILASVGESAYDTKPTEYLTAAESADTTGETTQPTTFDALRMDVHLTVPNDLVVKGSDLKTPDAPIGLGAMNVTLGGDLRATKDPGGAIRLVGVVNTIRGTYDFQGRRFDILRDGTVRFDGTEELDPSLDIRTRRLIQGVEARVNIRGTLRQPEIVLDSTPPLEQADILALIVFNQQLNQLGEGQQISLAQRAEDLAAGALVGSLAQSIGNALNLDTFEITTSVEGGGGAQLTIGQQVGQNLYVKVQQGIGEQSQTNVILEYELTNWLRLQSNVLEGSSTQQQLFQRLQGSGVDLLFFFSY